MIITQLLNGNLMMSADSCDRMAIRQLLDNSCSVIDAEERFISELLPGYAKEIGMQFTQVRPENVGALTSAPLISDGTNVYGYMDYQVLNFLDELMEGNTIVWQKG
jgi:hypothetical protein